MRFSDRPRTAQLYVAGVIGLALTVAVLAASQPALTAPAQLFGLLVIATAIAHSFPVSSRAKQSYHVSLPFFVSAIIVLAPLQLVALIAVVHLAERLRIRRSTDVQIFNAANYALTGLVAQAVYRALWPVNPDQLVDLSQPLCLVAGLAAAATFVVLNRLLVGVTIWLANGISLRTQQMFHLDGLLTDGILLLMGVPLAHLVVLAPWAAAVGAAPLWLIHRVLDLPNIRAQSRQDGLTELFTAPYLTETCTRELNRGRRFNRPVGLLLIDLDALGELNAEHGNQTGDAVLRAIARIISGSIREYDLPARLAGGLFAVLLPETDLAQAQVVAERVRRTTAERRHEVPGSVEQARATVSIGVAFVNGQGTTADNLFQAAEAALARAKHDGGNQIAFEAVEAPTLVAVPDPDVTPLSFPRPARPIGPAARRRGTPGVLSTWLRAHVQTVAISALAAIGLSICLVGAIAELDWPLLAVMLSLSAVAGLAVYFRSLPLAVALAAELNRSPMHLLAVRFWRLWPQYLAVGIGALLTAYTYSRLGLIGAVGMAGFAMFVRHLAGRYVDRTLESVRKLRNANEALEHQAFHDSLTNLPNRALFAERLEHAMLRAGSGSVAVLFVDLDNFKTVNDTLGHAAGDALLVAVTERLVQCVRREDTIARLGGDEFTVLLEDMRDPSDAARMAERIGEALANPFDIDGQIANISSSIGIALDTDRSHAPDDLMREADLAMYRAKSGGKACYEIFDPNMAERAHERLGLETELRQAIARGELVLYYQPIVSFATGGVAAMEAQLRWQHPRHGLLGPDEFLRIAEETGSVVELGAWALEQACRDARAWQRELPGVRVLVALSARQLEVPRTVDTVRDALVSTGLSPALLGLQLVDLDEAGDSRRVLCDLRALGVSLALDNVGTRPLSLTRLAELPIQTLRLHADASASADLVRGVVALAAALGMSVAAQGVASAEAARHLSVLGVVLADGPLWGEPVPVTDLATGTAATLAA